MTPTGSHRVGLSAVKPGFELSFEGSTTGFRGDDQSLHERVVGGPIQAVLGARFPVRLSGNRVIVTYTANDAEAENVGYELLRVVRGALGIHFGEPLEVYNVGIRRPDGTSLDSTPTGSWSIGWADVSPEELHTAFAFMADLSVEGPYARALDYFNQGRLLLRRSSTPEAAVVFFYKVLEALLRQPRSPDRRQKAWLADGFTKDECVRLDRLRDYRNAWDAAHAARGRDRIRMTHAYEAEATAQLVLERLGEAHGVRPQPPRRRVHFRGRDQH